MTILKNLILSLAIAPLAVSMALAANGGAGKATFKEFTMKEQVATPILSKESRVIKPQAIKPLAQTNPTRPSSNEEKELYHDENKSECYRRYGNPPTTTLPNGRVMRITCQSLRKRADMQPIEEPYDPNSGITKPYVSDSEYSRE